MMLRLSQKAWNNVLIFAMLLMILLFNTSNNILNRAPTEHAYQPLLPPDSLLMKIDFGDKQLERIGQSWRLKSQDSASNQSPDLLINYWQQAQIRPVLSTPTEQPYIAVVWLAGEARGREISLYPQDNLLEITGQHYQLEEGSVLDLLPIEN